MFYILLFSIFLSEVYKGTYEDATVAIKTLKGDTQAAQSFLQEASVMT